ncbi:MAG: GNAT family N-acetyltransferase [Mangrovicoccus sp.]
MPRPWAAAEFAELLEQRFSFLVADHPQAFALGRAIAGEAELLTIAVHPSAQGQGLGRATLAAFETQAVTRFQATEAMLEVAQTNIAARRLYEAAGFAQIGERPDYYRDQTGARVTALIYRKAFTPRHGL